MQGAGRLSRMAPTTSGPAKAYGRAQALRGGAGGADGADARANGSDSNGGRMRKGPSSGALGAHGARGAAGHSAGYKSVAGYNSMQIPEEDRHLLAALGP